MKSMWYICKRNCCEQPCVVYIAGGGLPAGDIRLSCMADYRGELYRPLTPEDVKTYGLSLPKEERE